MERKTISVTGMSCGGCEESVEEALKQLDGVSEVDADNETDAVDVVVEGAVSDEDLHNTIEQAGYEVTATAS